MHQSLMDRVRPSHLLHAAWYAEHRKFWDAIENVLWLKATLSLVESFCRSGGERFVGVGTCAEYDWRYGVCIERETPELPTSLYGSAKLSAGRHSAALAAAHDVSFAWTRIFFPYGPGESGNRLIPHVITSLLRGEIARCTHGKQSRDFLHVSDVGEAIAAVLNSSLDGPVNIGSGVPVAIRDVALRIGKAIGREDLIMLGAVPEPANSVPMVLAATHCLSEIGWQPQRTLDEGLAQTITWWRDLLAKK
jgi:nucleoside-diphosphate-sugar epimerase